MSYYSCSTSNNNNNNSNNYLLATPSAYSQNGHEMMINNSKSDQIQNAKESSCAYSLFNNWDCGYPMTSVFKIILALLLIGLILSLLAGLFVKNKINAFKRENNINMDTPIKDIIGKIGNSPQDIERAKEIMSNILNTGNRGVNANRVAGNASDNNNNMMKLITEEFPVVRWYSADWCGWCKVFRPNWEKIEEEFKNKNKPILFLKYNMTDPSLSELIQSGRKIKNKLTNTDETINAFPYFTIQLPGQPEEKIQLNAASPFEQWQKTLNSYLSQTL